MREIRISLAADGVLGLPSDDMRRLEQLFSAHETVYVYGAGRYGKYALEFLDALGLPVRGVLVTSAKGNPETLDGARVYQADKVDLSGCGVLLAVGRKYREEIRQTLDGSDAELLELPDEQFPCMERYAWNAKQVSAISAIWPHERKHGRMRVAIFTHDALMLGADLSLMDNLSVWKEREEFFPIVITRGEGPLNEALLAMKIPSIATDFDWWARKPGVPLRDNAKAIEAIAAFLSELGIDLCYTNTSVIDIGARVAEKLRVPHVWHVREFATRDFGFTFPDGEAQAADEIRSRSAAVLFVSKALESDYVSRAHRADNFHMIYNGVSLRHRQQKQLADFKRTPLRIVMVGGIHEGKNQQELIEAFARLSRAEQEQLELHFYGGGNHEYRAGLDRRIEQHGLGDRVIFHGCTSDVGHALASCEIGVMASRSEAFGRVTVEYMMSGLFVIASDAGANPELLRDGEDGLLYPLGDPEALADCLRWCLSHREEMAKIALRNQGRATEERFSPKRAAGAIYRVFEEVVRGDTKGFL